MRTVKKPKSMGVKKTAYTDSGFKQYMFDEGLLTPDEFDNFLKNPKMKHEVIDSYKKYLNDQIPF